MSWAFGKVRAFSMRSGGLLEIGYRGDVTMKGSWDWWTGADPMLRAFATDLSDTFSIRSAVVQNGAVLDSVSIGLLTTSGPNFTTKNKNVTGNPMLRVYWTDPAYSFIIRSAVVWWCRFLFVSIGLLQVDQIGLWVLIQFGPLVVDQSIPNSKRHRFGPRRIE